ncbi:phage shock protein PspC (stress-responsive transcriptional regulator) [Streptomyces aurantiacus]|uniref:PspC domain-containing protein n=1 Tax=Streptomyces aurantiacus TaxID=47760 RepID=UPI002792B71A|nr:PspC domain-containing protein [Streptomyces aurantiacus]MDQ0775042.1 phage shock protein PspC (stress-responsive transcriptional regulator) [Streptomyces aurantiacus]
MSDQQHAAASPGPGPEPAAGPAQGLGSGLRASPTPGTGRTPRTGSGAEPQDAVPTAGPKPLAAEDPPVPELPRRFRRDSRHKMLGGVCAGLGRQCDMDPVIFRIVLAVLSATGGIGLIFYGFIWLFVAYDDEEENEVRKLLTGRVDGQAMAAVLFALVGCGVFLSMLSNSGVLTFAATLALLLAGAGYWSRQRGSDAPAPSPTARPRGNRGSPIAAQAVADAPPEAQAPPVPGSFPSWWREPIVKDGTYEGGTGYLWGPKGTWDRDIAAAITIARGGGPGQDRRTRETKPRGPRGLGGPVFLFALIASALGTGLTWDDHTLGSSLQTGLACALAVFGLGIAVSAFRGRTGAGSVFLAIVTAGLLACSAALPKDITTHWERTNWTPAAVAAVQERYDLGTGVGKLDLSRIDLDKGQTVATRAEVGIGRLKVVVPKDVTVKLSVEVGVGDIQLPGDKQQDVDVAPGKHKQLTLTPADGSKDGGTLDLTLDVGVGQAEVARATS